MPNVMIFSGAEGLNVKTDPARIKFSAKSGVVDLAAALNVDIDDTGRVSRRKGFTKVKSGDCHSLFCDGGECAYASGTSLYLLGTDYTSRAVATVTENARVSYAQVNDKLFWMNGYEKGVIEEGNNSSWEKGTYYGPESDRELSDPPIGNFVAWYNGRIYIGQGRVVWYSEPFNYNEFDLARNFILFPHTVTMVRPVHNGIFIGTSKNTFFIGGDEPNSQSMRLAAPFPPIAYTDVGFTGRVIFDKNGSPFFNISGGAKSCIWQTTRGICYGAPDGSLLVLEEDKISLPTGTTGSGVIIDNRYISLIDP